MQAPLVFVGYIGLALFQATAIMAGLEEWLGLHWTTAFPVAYFVAYVPLIGTLVGILGATAAWSFPLWSASALFLIPLAVLMILGKETGLFICPSKRSVTKELSVGNLS
jgi:hypothetical protein